MTYETVLQRLAWASREAEMVRLVDWMRELIEQADDVIALIDGEADSDWDRAVMGWRRNVREMAAWAAERRESCGGVSGAGGV